MRTDILDRKEEIIQWIAQGKSKAEIARMLSCASNTLEAYLGKLGIVITPTNRQQDNKYKSAIEYLYNGSPISSYRLKNKILNEGLKPHKCEGCGLESWLNKPIPLELEHKDGDHYNNEWDNLALLCPNCHALTPTHAGKNIGRYTEKVVNTCAICHCEISPKATHCKSCTPKELTINPDITAEQIEYWVSKYSWVRASKELGLSDTGLRKRYKSLTGKDPKSIKKSK